MAIAALSSKNPYFIQRELDWTMMRDAYGGERYIKEKGQQYLPATASMLQDGFQFGQAGWNAYQAYRTRSVYHELVKPSLMAMLGVMHRRAPTIELPAKLDKMRKSATFRGESLEWLMAKINEQQMLMGRYGMLLDVANGAKPTDLPYIVGYNAESMINWDASKVGDDQGQQQTTLVILNETDYERRAGLAWVQMMRYRVLAMAGAVRDIWDTSEPDNAYIAAEVRHTQDATVSDFFKPQLAGKTMDELPFVFVGPRDLAPEPDVPVLMPMARLALAIYRTEADYRQALFMQGQDTLVVIGQQADVGNGRTRLGAFGSIDLPIGGDAKFIGAQSEGLNELSTSIQNDLRRAAQLGAQLLTERGNEAESGDALSIRVASRTATLTTIAQTAALGLERILKNAAVWVGADPDKVIVKPNLDFADAHVQAQDLVYMMTAKKLGAPLSLESIHNWSERSGFTDMTYEEEQSAIEGEPPIGLGTGTPGLAGVQGPATDALGGNLPGAQTGGNAAAQKGRREKDGVVGGAPAGSAGLGKDTPLTQ
jgi:hypothetical protein